MKTIDTIAKRYLELFRQEIISGQTEANTPWLDLDVKAIKAFGVGDRNSLPCPEYTDGPEVDFMMKGVCGLKVLCLAGGGGQQSVLFSLLGAEVTVFDLTPEQLAADQRAANHYGYTVKTIQGDMRDLSALPTEHFDRVFQPISTLFIPNLQELYRGVSRVAKRGALYYSDYAVPLLYLADNRGWDGTGYVLHVTEPYRRGAILETSDGKLNLTNGASYSEFHHLLSDIVNGLIAEGFAIAGLWENPRPDIISPDSPIEPGTDAHRYCYIPFGLSVIARRA